MTINIVYVAQRTIEWSFRAAVCAQFEWSIQLFHKLCKQRFMGAEEVGGGGGLDHSQGDSYKWSQGDSYKWFQVSAIRSLYRIM